MSLLKDLDAVDHNRQQLHRYETTWLRVFFMPKTREKMLQSISRRLRSLDDKRHRIMQLIAADPTLRRELQQRIEMRALNAQTAPHRQGYPIAELADQLVGLLATERKLKSAYQKAVWYYKSGDWKFADLAVETVTGLLDALKGDLHIAQKARLVVHADFENRVSRLHGGLPTHILQREQLLLDARTRFKEEPRADAFDRWIEVNAGKQMSAANERAAKRGRGR